MIFYKKDYLIYDKYVNIDNGAARGAVRTLSDTIGRKRPLIFQRKR